MKELAEEAGSLQPVLLAVRCHAVCMIATRGQADRQRYEDEVMVVELPPSTVTASSAVCTRVMMGPSRVGIGDRYAPQQKV